MRLQKDRRLEKSLVNDCELGLLYRAWRPRADTAPAQRADALLRLPMAAKKAHRRYIPVLVRHAENCMQIGGKVKEIGTLT